MAASNGYASGSPGERIAKVGATTLVFGLFFSTVVLQFRSSPKPPVFQTTVWDMGWFR